MKLKKESLFVKSGFKNIDKVINGFNKGDLIILGGASGAGKSSLVLNIALNVALSGNPVGFLNHRMSEELFKLKLLSLESSICLDSILKAELSSEEWIELTNVADRLSELKSYQEQLINFTLLEKLWRDNPNKYDLIIIDNIRCFRQDNIDKDHATFLFLKSLALKLNIPIIAISNLFEDEAGNADLIIELVRPILYDKDIDNPTLVELEIIKNRNGNLGKVNLMFLKELLRFEDY